MSSPASLPTSGYLVVRHERHPGGATTDTFLAQGRGAGGQLRWVPFDNPDDPKMHVFKSRTEAAAARTDVYLDPGGEGREYPITVESYANVLRRRDQQRRAAIQGQLAQDFRQARSDDPRNRRLLAEIGRLRMADKRAVATQTTEAIGALRADPASVFDGFPLDPEKLTSSQEIVLDIAGGPGLDDAPRSLRSDRGYRAFDSSEGRGLDGPSLC